MKKINQFTLFLALFLIVSCGSEEPKAEKNIKIEKEIKISPPEKEIMVEIQENESTTDTILIELPIIESDDEKTAQKVEIKEEIEIIKEEKTPITPEITAEIIEDPFPQRASHDEWNTLLKKHVSSSGEVNYKNFKTDRDLLNQYLEHLSDVSPTSEWSKNEKLAYWINLYNASTVKLIIDNYPVKSITEINNGKPWDYTFIASSGNYYTLNQIENDIIRPRFKESKIHVAVNCAAVSCPPLMNSAFLPEKLKSQLTKRAKSFINNQKNNNITADKIEVSKIFDWYKADFEKDGGVIGFINKYSDNTVNENVTITYLEYDWNLNEK